MRKYQSDGGPGIVEILKLLNGAANPRDDRLKFMKTQIVYWLLAAIDGHAKNFSIFLTPCGYKLTPLYDVMSSAPYPQFSDHKVKLAMALGTQRHYRLKEIIPRHFFQTAKLSGLQDEDVSDLYSNIAAQIDAAVERVFALATVQGAPEATTQPIIEGLLRRAEMLHVVVS